MSQVTLQRMLKFTDADLAANRQGKLSVKQRERMQPPKFNRLVMFVILGHMVLIGGILGAIALVTGEAVLWLVLLIVLGLGAVPFITLQNEGNLNPILKADVLSGKVVSRSGMVFLDEQSRQRVDLQIDGIVLKLLPRQAAAFKHEDEYTVYYLPQSLHLLTAEVLREN